MPKSLQTRQQTGWLVALMFFDGTHMSVGILAEMHLEMFEMSTNRPYRMVREKKKYSVTNTTMQVHDASASPVSIQP